MLEHCSSLGDHSSAPSDPRTEKFHTARTKQGRRVEQIEKVDGAIEAPLPRQSPHCSSDHHVAARGERPSSFHVLAATEEERAAEAALQWKGIAVVLA